MTTPNNQIWFRPGRLEKGGRRNPGITSMNLLPMIVIKMGLSISMFVGGPDTNDDIDNDNDDVIYEWVLSELP